jgi:YD repeat-containing protein
VRESKSAVKIGTGPRKQVIDTKTVSGIPGPGNYDQYSQLNSKTFSMGKETRP